MAVDPEIHQRLLELIYDVLPDDEAAELRRRIEAEPEVARAYAQAQAAAGLLAKAARFEEPTLELKRPEAVSVAAVSAATIMTPKREPVHAKPAARVADPLRKARFRGMTWLVCIAAGILLMVSLSGYYYHRGLLADIAADHLRVRVIGPSHLEPQAAGRYTVVTTSVTGTPVPSEVQFALFAPDGRQLLGHKERTNDRGQLSVVVPADLPVVQEARLEIETAADGKVERVDTRVAVDPLQFLTYLAPDKPVFRPGETVHYRSVTLARASLVAEPRMRVHYELLDPNGEVVPGSVVNTTAKHGVGVGRAVLSPDASDGEYTLVARSPEGQSSEQRSRLLVRREPSLDAKPESAPASDNAAGKVQVDFYPEGGGLVEGLENRVFFRATDSQGKPVEVQGTIFDGQSNPVAQTESVHEGMGAFSLTPRGEMQYRMKLTMPEKVVEEPVLPAAVDGEMLMTTGLGVFKAGQPLQFNVRAKAADIPLVAAAYCRGVAVGQQALVTRVDPNSGVGANSVEIALDENAAGAIRLVLYDYRSSPPKPIAQRLVYRRPAQRLQVKTGDGATYKPGQRVKMSVAVANESGQPERAVLGVSVLDAAVAKAGDRQNASMAAYFLLESQLERRASDVDFYLSEDPKTAVALDMLLGTQTPPQPPSRSDRRSGPSPDRFAAVLAGTSPPTVFDNLTDLQERYKDSLAAFRANRTRPHNSLTMLSLFGGLGLVLFVLMLAIMNIRTGLRLWVPAISAAAASTVIAAILMNPERLKSMQGSTVAFASFSASPTPADADKGGRRLAETTWGAKADGDASSGMDHKPKAPAKPAEPLHELEEKAPSFVDAVEAPVSSAEAPAAPAPAAPPAAKPEAALALPAAKPAAAKSAPVSATATPAQMSDQQQAVTQDAVEEEGLSRDRGVGKRMDFGRTAGPAGGAGGQSQRAATADASNAPSPEPPGDVAASRQSQPEWQFSYDPAQAAAAGVLYWAPLVKVGADGRTEIEFTLPEGTGEYRILVEAQSDGRLGASQVSISTQAP